MRAVLISIAALACAMLCARLTERYLQSAAGGLGGASADACPFCGRERAFWDTVPCLSWLLNGGRCRFCAAPLSRREPVLSGLIIFSWLICVQLWLPLGAAAALCAMLHSTLLLCAAGLILIRAGEKQALLIPPLCTGILGALFIRGVSLWEHLLGGAAAAGFLLLLKLLSGMGRSRKRIRWDTVWYCGCTGLLLGWRGSFAVLPGAAMTAGILLLLGRRKAKAPEGGRGEDTRGRNARGSTDEPSLYLTGGALLALLFGRQLMDWYIRLFIR